MHLTKPFLALFALPKTKSMWLPLIGTIVFTVCNAASAETQSPASLVKTDKVIEMSLPATADFMGTLHSRLYIPITAGVNGRLEWLTEPGIYVDKGDILVKMDLLPLQLRRAEQVVQIKRASINQKYLKNELLRLQQLAKSNSASQFQLDQTRSQYELSVADIEIAELKLRQVDDQIQRATIKAPFAGVVTERMVREGTDISRSDVLLKLLDTKHLEVRLFVPIKYLVYVHKGDQVALSTSTPNSTIVQQSTWAKISAVIPNADPLSQTFEVRVSLPEQSQAPIASKQGATEVNYNNIQHWSAGQLVKVTIPVQNSQPTLTVHRDALILRKEGTYVVKIDEENKAHRLLVRVGKGNVERVAIVGKLKHGDKVAIRGAERLQDGKTVVEG
jgi:RND family efflux transporter MFP subunit